jgi:hypothetical protein
MPTDQAGEPSRVGLVRGETGDAEYRDRAGLAGGRVDNIALDEKRLCRTGKLDVLRDRQNLDGASFTPAVADAGSGIQRCFLPSQPVQQLI